MTDFTTAAKVKSFFQISTNTAIDALLAEILPRITKEIQTICDRELFEATYTKYLSGNGTDTLMVPEYPITEITSIHDDIDRVYGADTLLAATDYIFHAGSANALTGIIKGYYTIFSQGEENIKIVFKAGYATMPGDIEEAAILMIGADKLFHDLVFNVPIPEGTYTEQKDPGGMRKRAKELLRPYVRVR